MLEGLEMQNVDGRGPEAIKEEEVTCRSQKLPTLPSQSHKPALLKMLLCQGCWVGAEVARNLLPLSGLLASGITRSHFSN